MISPFGPHFHILTNIFKLPVKQEWFWLFLQLWLSTCCIKIQDKSVTSENPLDFLMFRILAAYLKKVGETLTLTRTWPTWLRTFTRYLISQILQNIFVTRRRIVVWLLDEFHSWCSDCFIAFADHLWITVNSQQDLLFSCQIYSIFTVFHYLYSAFITFM